MGTSRCEHGYFPGYCFCFEPRRIETLEDAEQVYNSGRATPLEWERCYAIFAKAGYTEKAADCLVFGIEMIRKPSDRTNLAELIGDYISLQLESDGFAAQRGPWLKNLAHKLRRRQEEAKKNNQTKFASYLDEEIREASDMAEALILAKDGSKYALVRLAKKLRKPRKYDKFIRWNRPLFALEIVNELLAANAHNSYARNCRAAIHLDLGNITDSLADSQASIEQNSKDKAAWNINASAHLAAGDGTLAWAPLMKCWALEKTPPVLAMMYTAIGLIALKRQAIPRGHSSLRDWREWIQMELATRVGAEDAKKFQLVAQIASLRNLCNLELFLEALQFLAELEREGWSGATAFWDQEIRKIARASDPALNLPTLQELIINPADYFPDNIK